MNDPLKATVWVIGAISLNSIEAWAKILCALVPALVATAYTIWKWRKDAKK